MDPVRVDVVPLDPGKLEADVGRSKRTAFVNEVIGEPYRIHYWFRGETDDRFDELIDVLCHEVLHAVLWELEGKETTLKFDNITDRENLLVNGEITLDK